MKKIITLIIATLSSLGFSQTNLMLPDKGCALPQCQPWPFGEFGGMNRNFQNFTKTIEVSNPDYVTIRFTGSYSANFPSPYSYERNASMYYSANTSLAQVANSPSFILPFTTFSRVVINEFGGDFGEQDRFGYGFGGFTYNGLAVEPFLNDGYQTLISYGGVDNVIDEATSTYINTTNCSQCSNVAGRQKHDVIYGVPFGNVMKGYDLIVEAPTTNYNIDRFNLVFMLKKKVWEPVQDGDNERCGAVVTTNCTTTNSNNPNFNPVPNSISTISFKVTFFKN